MDGAHFHLMLNHFPIIGMTFASPLLLLAWGTKSEDLIRVGLGLVSLTGLLAVATFLTGEPAEEVVENLPGVAKRLITIHEEAAEKSLWGCWPGPIIWAGRSVTLNSARARVSRRL